MASCAATTVAPTQAPGPPLQGGVATPGKVGHMTTIKRVRTLLPFQPNRVYNKATEVSKPVDVSLAGYIRIHNEIIGEYF